MLAADGYEVERRVVADDVDEVAHALTVLASDAVLVLTTGGTGVAPRDVTPEGPRPCRARGAGHRRGHPRGRDREDAHGLLSRGVAGVLGTALLVNLPGSTGGCRDGYAVLRPALDHALRLLSDEATEHVQT